MVQVTALTYRLIDQLSNCPLPEFAYICVRQVLHDQLLLNPPRAGRQQE